MKIENLWYSNALGYRLLRLALSPLTALYTTVWEVYRLIYRLNLRKTAETFQQVICIGNLTSGGAGKTPVTIFVAECLNELGKEVIISCSGYGSPASEAAQVAPVGPLDPKKLGDEPTEIRDFRPNDTIIVGRRRPLAARLASQVNPGAVLLMDDGFQHMPIKKHISILLDPQRPINPFPLPIGPYREPRWNRRFAELVLPNDRFRVNYSPLLFSNQKGEHIDRPARATILTAIARPDLFEGSLRDVGVEIESIIALPDHHPLDDPDLLTPHNEKTLVVTMKDWVKLRQRTDIASYNIVIAKRTATIEPSEEFKQWLKERLW